jgi:uncharacterized protein (TIGR02996 family)
MAKKRAPPKPEVVPRPLTPQDEAFLQAILEAPEDDAPRLVYADWLEENGDPERAEFIRVQIRFSSLGPDDPAWARLQAREQALWKAHAEEWLAPLPRATREWVVFERGFPGRVSCPFHELPGLDEGLWKVAPVTGLRLHDPWSLDSGANWGGTFDSEEEVRALHRERVREVAAAPQLARFTRLECQESDLDDQDVRVLTRSRHLTRLRHLDLSYNWIGTPGARTLARWPGLGRLTFLDLSANRVGNGGAQALAGSPRTASLTILRLSDTGIGDEGARALARSPHLANLATLDLSGNPIGPAGRAELRERFGGRVLV